MKQLLGVLLGKLGKTPFGSCYEIFHSFVIVISSSESLIYDSQLLSSWPSKKSKTAYLFHKDIY